MTMHPWRRHVCSIQHACETKILNPLAPDKRTRRLLRLNRRWFTGIECLFGGRFLQNCPKEDSERYAKSLLSGEALQCMT
jgi:hypothetical protein